MDTIDYQTPQNTTPAGSTAVVFWTAFLVAAIAGVAIASVLDEAVYHYIMGHYPDGGVTIISTAGIPMSAIAAAITRSIRKPKRTGWVFAACCGLIAS
ncbi:MAG TPA: hypothetical protein VIM11_22160, partial [Tepidisphaeraceae bacterium]